MAEDWERVDESPSRVRWAGLALLAILVLGLLARPAPDEPAGGLLDVAEVEASQEPEARPSSAPTRPTGRPTPRVRSVHTPSPEPTGPEPVALPGYWVEGAAQPGPLQGWASVAWDGARRLYVFGGQTWNGDGSSSSFHDAAWRYDVDDDAWTALPQPPLDPRTGAAAAWTGEEFVVWGGMGRARLYDDGAAFDPARGVWRRLTDAPLSARHGAAVVRIGADLLVAGGGDHGGSLVDGALYDPVADRWSGAPDLPVVGSWGLFGAGVVAGAEAVIWLPEQWGPEQVPPLRFVGGAWEVTALPPGYGNAGGLWGLTDVPGHGVLALHADRNGGMDGMGAALLRLPSGTSAWEAVSDTVLPHHPGVAAVTVQQRYYIAVSGNGQVHAYDLPHDRWLDVHRAPRSGVHGMPVFPLDDGFLLLVTPTEPEGVTEVLRFVIGGEPLDPAEVEPAAPVPRTPAEPTTPRP